MGSIAGSATVDVAWAPSVGGAPVAGYEVRAYEATSGASRAVGGSCAGVVAGTTCTDTAVPNGSWRYSVIPRQLAWAGVESPRSDPALVDSTPPAITIAFPSGGGAYNDGSWAAACGSAICGTASDADSGVASVAVSVRQGSGNYWNGSGFSSAAEVLLAATGTTAWSLAFAAAAFPADGAYTVRAVAADLGGGTASGSVTFSIDRTGPSPTALTLFNANGVLSPGTDEIRITFSEPLDVASVCSAWSGAGDQSLGGSGVVVTITNNGADDVVSVAAGACVLHVGSVATGRDYVALTSTFSGATAGTESRVTWTAASRLLVVHVGSQTSGLANVLPQAAGTATYSPNAAITDAVGNAVVTTPFSAAAQRF
ncbi:MAG: hypothetical protein ACRDFY_07395 [Candidatus Limnocylindria bacterium]